MPLTRPRNIIDLQKAPEFGELVHRIWSGLREEVHRAREPGAFRSIVMTVQTVAAAEPQRNWTMSMRARERILAVASPLALLLVWEFAARFGFIDVRFFPAPSSVHQGADRDAALRAS